MRLAPIWVFEQDAQLRYTWLQNADTAGHAGGATDADLMERPDEAERVQQIKARVLASGMPNTVELVAHVAGEPRRHRVHIEPRRDAEGRVVGLRGAILDLGPATPAAEDATSALALLRLVGHELRNAVNPVRMLVQLERRRAAAGAASTATLATAHAGVERLTALLEDMLDYARSTAEPLPLQVTGIDLEAALVETRDRFLVLHPEAEARLAVAPPPEGTTVRADPRRLRQCLLALLDRAARSTDRSQRIMVAAIAEADVARVEIVDDGAGLPGGGDTPLGDPVAWAEVCLAEQRDEPPFAFALAHQLTAAMGGALEVSAGPRGGTEVRLTLPLAARSTAPAPRNPAPQLAPLDILVVDDSPGATHTLRLLLEGDGHTVREAQTGAQCLAEVSRQRPDVVLLDLGLPDIPGLEVARALRREHANQLAVVGLTGRATDEDRRASEAAGMDEHLVKPVDLAQLREALAALSR